MNVSNVFEIPFCMRYLNGHPLSPSVALRWVALSWFQRWRNAELGHDRPSDSLSLFIKSPEPIEALIVPVSIWRLRRSFILSNVLIVKLLDLVSLWVTELEIGLINVALSLVRVLLVARQKFYLIMPWRDGKWVWCGSICSLNYGLSVWF